MNSTFILFATELKSHSFLILFFYFWNLNENYAVPAVYVTPAIKGNFFTILIGWKENRCAFNPQKKIFRNVTCFRFFPFYNANEKTSTFFPHLLSIYHHISQYIYSETRPPELIVAVSRTRQYPPLQTCHLIPWGSVVMLWSANTISHGGFCVFPSSWKN